MAYKEGPGLAKVMLNIPADMRTAVRQLAIVLEKEAGRYVSANEIFNKMLEIGMEHIKEVKEAICVHDARNGSGVETPADQNKTAPGQASRTPRQPASSGV